MHIKKILRNLVLLTLPSALFFLVAMEFLARWILPVSDYPSTVYHPVLGNHFAPNQTGVYIKGPDQGIQAVFRINPQGWNSPHDYKRQKPADTFRVAVIGDSYVEALTVDITKSFSYLMESQLNRQRKRKAFQVYSFGHSGSNLAHHLKLFSWVGERYHPDLVILLIIHNDFMESFQGYGRVDNWTLKRTGATYSEVSPQPADTLATKRLFRHSALARYLVINLSILSKFQLLRDWFYGNTRKYSANISVDQVESFPEEKFEDLLQYIFGRLSQQAEQKRIPLLLVINTPGHGFKNSPQGTTSQPARFNQLSRKVSKQFNIPFLDLTDTFRKSWQEAPKPFTWKHDGHWNLDGNRVVSQALSQWILDHIDE